MDFLIKDALITDLNSPYHGQQKDIRVKDNQILAIENELEGDDQTEILEYNNTHISPGWLDMRVHFCDPGTENREDLKTGAEAAARGGFTQVGLLPVTDPPLSSKAQIHYIKSHNASLPVELIPYATIGKAEKSNEITEMIDLHHSGVNAFTNGDQSIQDAGFLKRAMLYSCSFGGLIILYPQNYSLQEKGEMNEGAINLQLGLNGNPDIAEHIAIARDLELAKYTGARVHFSKITTSRSVELIEKAKNEGLPVSADVSIHHLIYSDENLLNYNTQLKFTPPLRTNEDQEELKNGLKKGIIDSVVSDHWPVIEENKRCEFPLAEKGAIGLQTLFPFLLKAFGKEELINKVLPTITHNPRKLLGISENTIKEGETANLTLYNPDQNWTFDNSTNASKSSNSPVYGEKLTGLVLKTIF